MKSANKINHPSTMAYHKILKRDPIHERWRNTKHLKSESTKNAISLFTITTGEKNKRPDRIGNTSFRRIMWFWGSLRQLFRGSCRIRLGRLHCRYRRLRGEKPNQPIDITNTINKTKDETERDKTRSSKSEIEKKKSQSFTCLRTIRISSFRRRRHFLRR